VVHGGIMTVQAIVDPVERGHLMGDVPALFIVAIVLAMLTPRRAVAQRADGSAVHPDARSGANTRQAF
jgi:hypothetical protein